MQEEIIIKEILRARFSFAADDIENSQARKNHARKPSDAGQNNQC